MSALRKVLDLLPHDTLVIGGRPYMRRWYLLGYAPGDLDAPVGSSCNSRTGRWWNLPFAVRLHQTVASDDSRAFHDHPWPFVSIGLRGSYLEERPGHLSILGGEIVGSSLPGDPGNRTRTYSAPFLNIKSETDLHVLTVVDGPVWTLFFTARKVRTWGFSGPFGWLPWREFDRRFPERDAWTETDQQETAR